MSDDVKMVRLQDSQTGSIVNVDEEAAAKMGPTWGPADSKSSASKSSSSK